MSKIWFITGAGRGFGREFTIAAAQRGDRVAATARDAGALEELAGKYGDAILPIALDVTDPAAGDAVRRAHDHFGGLDVVVNNAGYGHFGMVEELSEVELRDQLETNLFGALRITQAALPLMRAQQRGHIVQMSSVAGLGSWPDLGGYHASKWALEAISEALAQEVAPFGVHVTMVEPTMFGTDWAGSSARRSAPVAAYDGVREYMAGQRGSMAVGDPGQAAQALLEIVDAPKPPLRVLFGADAPELIYGVYADRLAGWRHWEPTARRAS